MKLGLTNQAFNRISQSYGSTVYRNINDTVRMDVYRVYDDNDRFATWTAIVFEKDSNSSINWASEAADIFPLKRDLMQQLVDTYGTLRPMGNISTVTQGWDEEATMGPEPISDEPHVVSE